MPATVKTERDERLWRKAKAIATGSGRADDYAYITGIYKRMVHEAKHSGGDEIVIHKGLFGRTLDKAGYTGKGKRTGTPGHYQYTYEELHGRKPGAQLDLFSS